MKNVTKHPVATAIASAIIIGFATASWAAPVLSNAAALVGAAPSTATHVDERSAARSRANILQNLEFGTGIWHIWDTIISINTNALK